MEDLEYLDQQVQKNHSTITTVVVATGTSSTVSGPAGGDLSGSYPNPTLAPNGAKATIYGDYPWMPQFTTDLKGRIVSASTIAIQGLNPANATNGSPTGIIIPMYDYPANVFTNPDYNAIIDMKKRYHTVPLYVILNPGNGPGTVTDNNYTEAALRLEGAGALTLGYVHASYAGRPLADVETDVQQWKNLYPSINGIFVDEMSNDYNMTHITYFVNLSSFSHALGFYPVVGNPGSTGDNVYFSSHTADIICIYESGAYPSTTTLAGNYFGGYADLTYIPRAVLSYNVAMDTGVWTRTREYAGLMYFTDINGWSSPATYLEKEFQFLSNETTDFYQNEAFSGNVTMAGQTMYGPVSGASYANGAGISGYWAQSYDGTTESSGCIVVLAMQTPAWSSNPDPAPMVFTSTTTDALNAPLGVLLQSCAPLAVCPVGTRGPMRVQRLSTTGLAANSGYGPQTSATRCQADEGKVGATLGPYLDAADGSGWAWVLGDGD